jgi:hypothetical protein
MKTIGLIQELKHQGINLEFKRGILRLDSGTNSVSQDVRKTIEANKTVVIEILGILKSMETDWTTLQSMEPYICGSSEFNGTPAYEQTFQRFTQNLERYEREAGPEPDYLSLSEAHYWPGTRPTGPEGDIN